MKLSRIGNIGEEKPVIIDKDDNYRDLSLVIKDFDQSTLNFDTLKKISEIDINSLLVLPKDSRIGACVKNPSKFIGIGLNFKDHALEQNLPIPKEPIIFSKFTNCANNRQIIYFFLIIYKLVIHIFISKLLLKQFFDYNI